ncbi:hypothetical protein GOP47_0031141, partial [Adiantum capillus-veneris]
PCGRAYLTSLACLYPSALPAWSCAAVLSFQAVPGRIGAVRHCVAMISYRLIEPGDFMVRKQAALPLAACEALLPKPLELHCGHGLLGLIGL